MTHRESAALLVASMLLLSVSSVLMPSEVDERFFDPESTTAQDLSSSSSEEPPSTLDIHPDAGPDKVVEEGSVVSLDGTRSYQDEIVRVWSDSFDNLSKVDSYVNVTIESGSVHLNETSFAVEETFADFSGFQLEDDQALTQLWWDSVQEVLAWHSDIGDPTDTWEKLVKSTPFEVTDRFDFIGHVDYVYTNAQTRSEAFPLLFMDANSIRVTDLYGPANNAIDFSTYGGALSPPLDDRHALRFYDGSGGQHNTLNILYDSHFNERIQAEVRFDSQTRTLEAELQDHFGSTLGIGTSLIPPGAFSLSKFGIGAMGRGFSGTSDGYSDNMTLAAWGYNDGEVVSVQIDPQEPFENWSWLDINSVEPSGTDIKVDVLDEFGMPLVTNIDSDDCPFSLSGLIDPGLYPKIVLKASLTTTWNETPLLLDWNVSYSIPSPLTFTWDINDLEDGNSDGNFTNDADLTGPIVFYQYGDDGAYSATLTINNTFGNVSTDSCIVVVENEEPFLSVTFPASPRVGSPLTFEATASDPGSDDLTFTWDWGDGMTTEHTYFNDGMGPDPPNSPDVNPMTVVDQWDHTYSQGGTYLVNLTVVDDDGGSTTETYELTLFSAEAGPDQVVNEGETVQLSGSGSEGGSLGYYWSDDFDDDSRISESVNTTVGSGSVVLADLSFSISHSFDTDPGFVVEDDMPNTEIWWDAPNGTIRWYTDREDPRDHYEKLIGFFPFPVTNAMDISARVDYMYWRADTYAVADPLLLQNNGSWRLGTKWGPNNNTVIMRVYGGDPLLGDVDLHAGFMWDNPGTSFQIYQTEYDMHYWELLTSRIAWDSDTETMYGEVRDPIGTLVGSGTSIISENFTLHKYGVGSYGEGNIDGNPHIGEGFADNYSISAFGYRTPGWVTSEVITAPGPSGAWGVLNVSAVEPNRTQIDIQVLDEFGTPIVSGIRPSDCPLSLDGLIDPATYPKIMLKAILSTDRNETPALLSWNVSYHAQSAIISYQWDVNQFVDLDSDGNYTNDVDLVGENVSYAYGDNGLYIVHLTVLDSKNETTVDFCNITVLNLNPTASATPPPSPPEGVALTFDASSDDPGSDDLTFKWDWGDGSNESWTYFNDGMGPDPPNSPDVNPMTVVGQWSHTYGHGGVY
ncbi:MAG: PKD domain-containing protein, partial [Candidatus Thermoplasmatota archaeon]|nr:PKD domain-containing protein [Candidatus Thermoplasmatota archaeon]